MAELQAEFLAENCENCAHLTAEDTCGNALSVYCSRPVVYRDGDEVLQTGWCDVWEPETSPRGIPAV